MGDAFELKYDDYIKWYEAARKSYLEPARITAERLVTELLDERVDSVDRGRFRIAGSRVKTAQRSFSKLRREKYRSRIDGYPIVPDVIDDLVGLRIVCNNLSDINTLQEVFGELPLEDGSTNGLTVEQESHRDYFSNPKPSGYRAYHVNLVVQVPQTSGHRRVRVEVQARTLLQDGWGELTHEDTYKPGSSVPEWIVGMSLRMAELLAAVDNIAQDLRTGLDVETQRSVDSSSGADLPDVALISDGSSELVIPTPSDTAGHNRVKSTAGQQGRPDESEIEAALRQETRRLVGALSKPTALAVLAHELNTIFGTDITRTWTSFGGFKRFLRDTAPDALISGPAPGYIHPPNVAVPESWLTEDTGKGAIPDLVRELRTYDKGIPLLGAERLEQVIQSVANVLHEADLADGSGNANASQIEALARLARSDGEMRDRLVVRPHAAYVLQALSRASRVARDTSVGDIRVVLYDRILQLAEMNNLVPDHDVSARELRAWLGIGTEVAELPGSKSGAPD